MCRSIVAGLSARGYEVLAAATARTGLAACSETEPDIVLLDLGLPDIDGVEVCRHLRRWTQIPIIVLTADGSESRKVEALDMGADDYVTKPFSMVELHARVRVAVRHRRALAAVVGGSVLRFGALQIDVAGHAASVRGVPLELTRREIALLSVFALNCGKVLTHGHLLASAWDPEHHSVSSLRSHVATLRRKLGTGPDIPRIVTESGTGYRMLQPD